MTTEIKVRTWLWVMLTTVMVLGGGFTYWYTAGNKGVISPTTSPTPTLSTAKESPSVSPTSATTDWQTYKNDTYEFSFKYPKYWKISSDNFNSADTTAAKAELVIEKNANEKLRIIGNFEGGFEDAADIYMSEIKNGKINITKKTQTESSTSNYVTTSIITINNDLRIFVQYYYPAGQRTSALTTFDEILSTFQFTK